LEGDGFNAAIGEYNRRFRELSHDVSEIEARVEETSKRPVLIEGGKKLIDEIKKKLLKMNETRPWVKEDEKNSTITLIHDYEE